MTQFESRLPEIEAAGAQLAFIAAEKRGGIWKPEKFLQKHPIASPFLLDEDRTVTKAYGLHHALGTDAIDIAHPATLLIARDTNDKGLIRYIYRGNNQLDRAPLGEIVQEVQKLSK
jgi:peroxiredoxin